MDARRGPFDDFAIATAVLTRLPVGTAATEDGTIAAAGWAFPLVGAGGGAVAAVGFLLAGLLGLWVAAGGGGWGFSGGGGGGGGGWGVCFCGGGLAGGGPAAGRAAPSPSNSAS